VDARVVRRTDRRLSGMPSARASKCAAHGAYAQRELQHRRFQMLPIRSRGSALDSLLGMSREMDRLVGAVWPEIENGTSWPMPTEIIETDEELRFEVEMPGFRDEDIEVTIENNVLTISGEKRQEREEGREDSEYRMVERRYGRFQRSFTVPPTVRGDDTQASYENGVLKIRLPKSEEAKPRRIPIGSGNGSRRIETTKN
jgi:HSP20 family protein